MVFLRPCAKILQLYTEEINLVDLIFGLFLQPCNLECIAIKESIENLMARVGEFGSSMHTFKEDLQKTLDKLNANSF